MTQTAIEIKISPNSRYWNGDAISLQVEDKNGKGQTVLHYGNNRTIILSEIVGITRDKIFNVKGDIIEWISSHGFMKTDGRVITRTAITYHKGDK